MRRNAVGAGFMRAQESSRLNIDHTGMRLKMRRYLLLPSISLPQMRFFLAAIAVLSLLGNGYLGFRLWRASPPPPPPTQIVQTVAPPVVMRTAGGLLEVSTVTTQERFASSQNHTILGVGVGTTIAQIQVPAVFRYHIELAKEWTFRSEGDTLIVSTPPVRPSLPVAIDTGKLQAFSGGVWSPFLGTGQVAGLQSSITNTLAAKATTPELIQVQRESARKTVTEFVQKWVVGQPRWRGIKPPMVLVFFADEPLGAHVASH
jgi:hypothetical protein